MEYTSTFLPAERVVCVVNGQYVHSLTSAFVGRKGIVWKMRTKHRILVFMVSGFDIIGGEDTLQPFFFLIEWIAKSPL